MPTAPIAMSAITWTLQLILAKSVTPTVSHAQIRMFVSSVSWDTVLEQEDLVFLARLTLLDAYPV